MESPVERIRKILLADDEPAVRKAFKALLEAEGFAVATARDGAEAVAAFEAEHPDVVILDIMMPKKNGLAACAEIRSRDALTPVLFFTAMPSEASVVRGLGYGADDYMAKDCPPEEFLARIRAALRRADAAAAAAAGGGAPDTLSLGPATVDFGRLAVYEGGERRELTRTECAILRLLAGDRGRFFDHAEIFAAIHGEGFAGDERALRSAVSRLKSKLGRAGGLVRSARRVGYRLLP